MHAKPARRILLTKHGLKILAPACPKGIPADILI